MTRFASMSFLLGSMAIMAALLVLLWSHPDREVLLAGGAVVLIISSLILEKLHPFNNDWLQTPRAELAGDIGSFVLIFGIIDSALKWLTPFVVLGFLPQLGALSLPPWQQVILVTLWIEFAGWASHWAHHKFKPLWALHAMHHSTEHLYTLNNFRFHPFNHIINHLAMIMPPLLVGFSADAILIYTALSLPVLLLQHSNVAFDFGFFNRIFNTNDLHRWHHSTDPQEGVSNLGRSLVLWDQLFGTYLRPTAKGQPAGIGLFTISRSFPAPTRFFAQLAWPFSRECCK